MNIKIEKNDDGFLATCSSIEGAFAEGNSEFDALFNLFDVIRMIRDYRNEKCPMKSRDVVRFNIPIIAS